MKTFNSIFRQKGFILTICLVLFSSVSKANGFTKFLNTIYDDLFGAHVTGFYIIGGILGFGIVAYFVSVYIESKQPPEEEHSNIKHINNTKAHHYGHYHYQKTQQGFRKTA